MLKPLRQARVYGFLIERGDGVYHLGGSRPACSTALAMKMVEGGWLVKLVPARALMFAVGILIVALAVIQFARRFNLF